MSEMMRESPGFLLDGAERKRKEGEKKTKQRTLNKPEMKPSELVKKCISLLREILLYHMFRRNNQVSSQDLP